MRFLERQEVNLMDRINFTKYNLVSLTIGEVIEIIRRGNYNIHDNEYRDLNLQEATNLIRSQPDDMQNMKYRLLPAVAFNGTFSEITETGIETYSQITALDFDHVCDMEGLKARLTGCAHVFCVFTTPSGNGLKALVLHDNTDPSKHRDMYEQLLSMFTDNSSWRVKTQVAKTSPGGIICVMTLMFGLIRMLCRITMFLLYHNRYQIIHFQ